MPSKTKAQRNLMAAAAHNPAFAKKVGVPTKVAKEFNRADKGKKFKMGGDAMKHEDIKLDKKTVKKAVGMHDKQMHGGKKTNLSKLKEGGKVSKKELYSAATKMNKEKYSPMETLKEFVSPKKAPAKAAPKKYARGGGVELRGKTKGRMV